MTKSFCRKELISLCTKYCLPVNVKSTSIKIYNKIFDKVKVDNLLYLILIVAAKCEEVHTINISSSLIKNESLVHEALNFEYDFPSSYLKMCSLLVKLQIEHKVNYNDRYEEGCKFMDLLLINDDGKLNDLEKACIALQLPDSLAEKFCDLNKIKDCKNTFFTSKNVTLNSL
ncbi:hypothetical protein NCER_100475 [Vairimorpha ceranae BRL01]|uniref:Uncharacterized protein n=2 Tax=Vairimorpha ceranae TaxID=40302 RepID=C4V7N9_VAIC1|nr:nucleotide excision repair factor tfiih tfiik subunit cyclin h-like protein [Vairimorpha ceranae]EEQ82757.1 hypothetical protein NCER_100475 [Vairimorpha ceranae BRL01]KAF5140594.1 hypothetical protein G9O61_00g013990 [Vairimorpha ceranae]KKO75403.1 nucleotide excision repair factor tfiih tfiik subunit cyclin h-like protein [Vairimorpha ceranae]